MSGFRLRLAECRSAFRGRPTLVRTLIGLSLFLFAQHWCSNGIAWSVGFHPDEFPVARWIDQVRDNGYIVERPYPGGWFEMARIRIAVEDFALGVEEGSKRHRTQDGFVSALSEHSFRKTSPSRPEKTEHGIQWGRDFNVWLYSFTILFLYLGALEAGLGIPGAVVSAVFFLLFPSPLEHAHYCETDPGVLATLALSLWLMVRAARKTSPVLTVAAGFIAGFCVSCKYTVGPLLFCPAILAAILAGLRFRDGGRLRRIKCGSAFAALAFLAAVAGFLVGTPVLFHDLRMALTELRENPHFEADPIIKIGSLFRETAKLGFFPLLWLALSLSFWPRHPWRARFVGPLLFLALFLLYVLIVLPWFRNQELLPVLCALSLGAGIPVSATLRAGVRRSPARAGATFAALAAALVASGCDSLRMLSCFELRDTRAECQNFLAASFPRGGALALEGYVAQVARGVPDAASYAEGHVAERWPESARDECFAVGGARYLVRNASQRSRQAAHLRERFSDRLRPEAARAVDAFRRDTVLLRAWMLPPGRVRPVFAQPDVELCLLPGDGAGRELPDVPIPFSRPALVLAPDTPLYDASGAAWFGPRQMLRTVGKRRTVRLVRDGSSRWAVSRLVTPSPEGTPVRVVREGPFVPDKSPLGPGETAVAVAHPSRIPDPLVPSVFPKSRFRIRGDDQKNICLTFLASDPAEAAMELRRAGNAADALALLRGAGVLTGATARVEAFLAASAAGAVPEAAWESAARDALDAWDSLASAVRKEPFPEEATICAVPLRALLDFSRIRVWDLPVGPGVPTPIAAPPGTYRIECRVEAPFADRLAGLVLFEGQSEPFVREDATDGGPVVLRAEIRKTGDGLVRFSKAAPDPFTEEPVALSSLEISWNPLDFVAESAETLRRALSSGQRPHESNSSGENLRPDIPFP